MIGAAGNNQFDYTSACLEIILDKTLSGYTFSHSVPCFRNEPKIDLMGAIFKYSHFERSLHH